MCVICILLLFLHTLHFIVDTKPAKRKKIIFLGFMIMIIIIFSCEVYRGEDYEESHPYFFVPLDLDDDDCGHKF